MQRLKKNAPNVMRLLRRRSKANSVLIAISRLLKMLRQSVDFMAFRRWFKARNANHVIPITKVARRKLRFSIAPSLITRAPILFCAMHIKISNANRVTAPRINIATPLQRALPATAKTISTRVVWAKNAKAAITTRRGRTPNLIMRKRAFR